MSLRQRYRKLFPFQLDLTKPDEYEIALEIQDLKRKRTFSRTVRDGIRLICDLRKGRIQVLQELFPWVLEQQYEGTSEEAIEKVTSNTEDVLKRHIERLESLILQQGALPVAQGQKPSEVQPPRRFTAEDDIELEVKQSTNTKDNNASWNFMIASAAQVYGNFDGLPAFIIDYGLRTGRIPADMVKRKPVAKPPDGNPKKLANADVTLSTPEFDDLEDFYEAFLLISRQV